MTSCAKSSKGNVIPGLRYRDAAAMIDWLWAGAGIEKGARSIWGRTERWPVRSLLWKRHGDDRVGGYQPETSGLMVQPSEVGGRETQTPYLVVTDCDAIYALAKAAGAEMVLELEEKEYGGKLFTCRNPEGHIW